MSHLSSGRETPGSPMKRGGEEDDLAPDVPVEMELDALLDAYDHRVTILYMARLDPRAPARKTRFDRRLERACAARRVSFVSVRDGYRDLIAAGLSPYGFANTGFNTGHLNATGHALLARLLRPELERIAKHGLL